MWSRKGEFLIILTAVFFLNWEDDMTDFRNYSRTQDNHTLSMLDKWMLIKIWAQKKTTLLTFIIILMLF